MENQKQSQKFLSEDGRIAIFVDNDVPVSQLHDFCLSLKGYCVDLLVNAQNQEVENKQNWDAAKEVKEDVEAS